MRKSELAQLEEQFGQVVLGTKEAREFFRQWRHRAAHDEDAWSRFRDGEFATKKGKTTGATIVTEFKKHLVHLQGNRCCYCRRWLQGISHAKPIEHVLSRSDYSRFTFFYRNCAVSCFDCNAAKTKKNWSGYGLSKSRYITERECKNFFHPRLHRFDDHVRFVHMATNGVAISVYVGLTPQGRQICRDLLSASAKRELILNANSRLGASFQAIRDELEVQERPSEKLETFLTALGDALFEDS